MKYSNFLIVITLLSKLTNLVESSDLRIDDDQYVIDTTNNIYIWPNGIIYYKIKESQFSNNFY